MKQLNFRHFNTNSFVFRKETSLRSRRLEVVGEWEDGRARGRHARGVSFSKGPFFLDFQAPATQARKKERRLQKGQYYFV